MDLNVTECFLNDVIVPRQKLLNSKTGVAFWLAQYSTTRYTTGLCSTCLLEFFTVYTKLAEITVQVGHG